MGGGGGPGLFEGTKGSKNSETYTSKGLHINSHQNKHIPGTREYQQSIANGEKRSILTENPLKLLEEYAGTGQKLTGSNKERVDFGRVIGQHYNDTTGQYIDTTNGIIHYDSRGGAHIVPSNPLKEP